jgi:hypothetical protein
LLADVADATGSPFGSPMVSAASRRASAPGLSRSARQRSRRLVERVALVATPVQGVLLDTAADLVDDLHPEGGDVERVQDVGRVGQLLAQRVEVAAENGSSAATLICSRQSSGR